jgi:UDP-GlcNAc:undecaprenyl-phosphate GlcNAc-1-phosphate transferase
MLTSIGVYNSNLDLTFPIIVFGVPIIDTLKVMMIRLLNKKNPFHPDKTHIHHVIYDKKIHHKFTVFIIQISTIAYLVLALLYYQGFQELAVVFFFVLGVLMVFADFIFAKVQFISRAFQRFYNKSLKKLPENFYRAYRKFLIPLTVIVSLLMLVLLIPTETALNKEEILFLLVVGAFVVMLAYIHYRRTREIAGIYVLLNTIVYMIFSSLSVSFYHNLLGTAAIDSDIVNYTFSFIILVVVIYIALKERFFQTTNAFFNGIDLIMIVLVCLLFIVNNIISFDRLQFLSISIFHAFILYLLFKIIDQMKSSLATVIFSVSFILPAFSLIYMLLT